MSIIGNARVIRASRKTGRMPQLLNILPILRRRTLQVVRLRKRFEQ